MSKLYNLKKAAWYSVENLTTIIFGLFTVVVVARIFGPENLGKLSMIQAISAVAMFMVVLGLDHIVVRDLAKKPDHYGYITTVLIVQMIGSLLHGGVVLLCLYLISDGAIDATLLIICLAVFLTTYFSRATVFKLYFQAINDPKKIAYSALISRLCALLYLCIALYFEFQYQFVVFFIPLQAFLQFVILLYDFIKSTKHKFVFGFDAKLAKKLLVEALPLIGSSILFPLFMQADILLISMLMTEKDVGIYSAAGRLITQFVFIGHIITMTFYVSLSNKKTNNDEDQDQFIQGLVALLFSMAFVIALFCCVFADQIIALLYGDKFLGAGDVLAILAWKWVFIFPAALYSRILILDGLGKYEFIKSLVVAGLSLSLNYLLIPQFGLIGAAYVSLLSYFIADFLIYSAFKKTRAMFYTGSKAVGYFFFNPLLNFKSISYTVGCR